MKIEKQGFFYTPKNVEELESYLTKFSGDEAVLAYTISGMTWNLLAEMHNEIIATNEKTLAEIVELKDEAIRKACKKPMFFDEWFAQGISRTLEYAIENAWIEPDGDIAEVIEFPGGCYIQKLEDNNYYVLISRSEYKDRDMYKIAMRLYMDHYIMECV